MIKSKDLKFIFFAEIGKTDLSSKASEELLNKLANRLNLYYEKNIAYIYYYPIYNLKYNLNWIISLNKKSDKKYIKYFLSTSVKLFRDLIYILNSLITIKKFKPKYTFFYNLNKLQILILSFIKIFMKTEINIIQADGYLLDKNSIKIFDNIIVFSEYTYKKYKKFRKTKLYFSYPYIRDKKMKKFKSKIKNKDLNLLHAGSISEYNTCSDSIYKLFQFCEIYPKCKIYFTTSQKNIPEYFRLLLNRKPSNFIYKGFLNNDEFVTLLKKMHIGLDLRNFVNINADNNKCDFPSKVIFYIRENLFVISTKSISIPKDLRNWLIPISDMKSLNKINFNDKEIMINSLLDDIEAQALDSIITKNFNLD